MYWRNFPRVIKRCINAASISELSGDRLIRFSYIHSYLDANSAIAQLTQPSIRKRNARRARPTPIAILETRVYVSHHFRIT